MHRIVAWLRPVDEERARLRAPAALPAGAQRRASVDRPRRLLRPAERDHPASPEHTGRVRPVRTRNDGRAYGRRPRGQAREGAARRRRAAVRLRDQPEDKTARGPPQAIEDHPVDVPRADGGGTPAEIATIANEWGDKNARGKPGQWSTETVLRILRNQVYAGRVSDGTRGVHTPLVAADLFERVNAAIGSRRTREPSARPDGGVDPFLLRGLLNVLALRPADDDVLWRQDRQARPTVLSMQAQRMRGRSAAGSGHRDPCDERPRRRRQRASTRRRVPRAWRSPASGPCSSRQIETVCSSTS